MTQIELIMKKSIRKIKRLFSNNLNSNTEPLIEIARINLKEEENSIFPTNKFEIKIWSNDHNPPHFHIIYNGWEVLFLIENGEELEIKHKGTEITDYNYIKKNAPIWLNMTCKLESKLTNKENAIHIWDALHSD